MDNPSRSERSRKAAIEAALTIIARDGPRQLTFDALARESGISKGGLLHQFPNKEAILQALLENQIESYEACSRDYLSGDGASQPDPNLAGQIASAREATLNRRAAAFGLLAAAVEHPAMLSIVRKVEDENVRRIMAEAADPDLALLRWAAARGLALGALLGINPISGKDAARLFDRLLDASEWPASTGDAKPRATRTSRSTKTARR